MSSGPKDKSAAVRSAAVAAGRDRVTLVVALGLVGLTVGGILAIFSAPLAALLAR